MEVVLSVIGLVIGLVVGAAIVFFFLKKGVEKRAGNIIKDAEEEAELKKERKMLQAKEKPPKEPN